MAEQVQKIDRAGQRRVRVLHPRLHEEHRRRLQVLGGPLQRLQEVLRQGQVVLVVLDVALDVFEEGHDRPAHLLGQLAAHQVERLHARRTLVDHGDAGVADELRHAGLLDIARAAEDLLGLARQAVALLGQEALHHRGQQRHHVARLLAHAWVGVALRGVEQHGDPAQEGAPAIDKALLVQQQPAHIGVHDQRVGRAVRVDGPGHRPALEPVAGIDGGVLVGGRGHRQPLHPDQQPGLVHHREHGPQALVLLADQPAGGIVVVHRAGGVGVDAHLLLDLRADHAVAFPQRAVLVDEEFRHHEQRDAPAAFHRAGDPGQHQVDDVLGHVVLARRDEDLRAGDPVGAVALGFGVGAQQSQIGAALGLGQVHRAGPVAGNHLRQVGRLLLRSAVGVDRGIGPVG